MARTFALLLGTLVLASGRPASADAFLPVPAVQGDTATPLRLRVKHYDGNTNGELTVEVKNPSKQAMVFDAQGLYFVPQGDADKAPQRLGAVGPLQIATDQGWQRRENLSIPPGASVSLKLDVYCIDSHRRSPSSADNFSLARTRMPTQLRKQIDHDAKEAAKRSGGFAAPASKSAVQSEVWKNRDKDWIRLQGEGRQERSK